MSRRSLNNYQQRHPLLTPIERWLHGKMHAVLGNSRAVLTQLEDEGVAADKLGLIYNGLDVSQFKPSASKVELRKNLSLPVDALVLLTVANFIPYKGHSDLLKALCRVNQTLPQPWVLLLVGRDDGICAALKTKHVRSA